MNAVVPFKSQDLQSEVGCPSVPSCTTLHVQPVRGSEGATPRVCKLQASHGPENSTSARTSSRPVVGKPEVRQDMALGDKLTFELCPDRNVTHEPVNGI